MKDAVVSARVESDVKEQAEEVLDKLGVPMSTVINALCRQIAYTQSIPFELRLVQRPKALDEMTKEEFDAKLQRGYEQSLRGEGRPMNEVFDELEARYK